MALLLHLEEFSDAIIATDEPDPEGGPTEAAKIASYEQGYAAGWEDSTAATARLKDTVSADFSHNLQELSFTYHEAHGQILRAMEPLLRELVIRFLPEMAKLTLAPLIVEKCLEVAGCLANVPVEIVISPINRPALDVLIADGSSLPVSIIEETTMAEGQADIRFSGTETRLDINDALVDAISAVDAFFYTEKRIQEHG